jgi:peroxiredoxin (alkyl hydroperoxide reductase subunit C)
MEITGCHGLQVGQDVPSFSMETYETTNYGFGKISLEELKQQAKWTVLFFYPADFTFVCSTELGDLAAEHQSFLDAGAVIVTVSTDTVYTHLAWKREEKFLQEAKFLMAADPTGNVSRLFGVYDACTGLALRGTFIISPQGKLVASEVNYYNVGRNALELLRRVRANVYVAEHPEEACPARWEQGSRTLTPGPELVGRVYEVLEK